MKLLFDQNLSRKLVARLADLYPQSQHVVFAGMDRADDRVVWQHAKTHQLCIVSKDLDFEQLSLLHGHPPKVIVVTTGNSPSEVVERSLRDAVDDVRAFLADETASVMHLP